MKTCWVWLAVFGLGWVASAGDGNLDPMELFAPCQLAVGGTDIYLEEVERAIAAAERLAHSESGQDGHAAVAQLNILKIHLAAVKAERERFRALMDSVKVGARNAKVVEQQEAFLNSDANTLNVSEGARRVFALLGFTTVRSMLQCSEGELEVRFRELKGSITDLESVMALVRKSGFQFYKYNGIAWELRHLREVKYPSVTP